ncbi:helix-turn-helix domain-containing protein [Dehalobacter sp. DCM]|uniref:helix-turn-helix domain-containing protein n=1 Tax=Dehalobacter sp. DCM TaxID=2907827 RepID=UPI003081C4BD|nr:helix-turn-helix domain-containing protein [Dehalobacter sp. DCM]
MQLNSIVLHKEYNEFECFSVSDVAKLLKVNKSFVYELVYSQKLKSIRFSERRIRISKTALEEFLEQELHKAIVYNNDVQPPKRGRKPKNVS